MATEAVIKITALDQTRAAFESAKRGLSDLQTTAVAVTGALSGIGVAVSIADLTSGVRAAINEWDELGKSAQRAGFESAQSISEFQYAARLAGVDAAGFQTAIGKLSDKMADAAGGGKQAAAVFQAMGIRVKDAAGNLRDTESVVTELAAAFAGYKDGPAKTALALELFGKAGKDLIPLLNGGKDGLEKLREEFRALRGVLDDGTTKAAETFNDNLTKLETSAGGLKRALAERLLPGLNQITEAMVEQAKRGNTLLTVWAGLAEFGKMATRTDSLGGSARNAEWLTREMTSKGAQIELLVGAKNAGGDSDGKLQARIDKLRRELQGLQREALAASRAIKVAVDPGYQDNAYDSYESRRNAGRQKEKGDAPSGRRDTSAGKERESSFGKIMADLQGKIRTEEQELKLGRELTEIEKTRLDIQKRVLESKKPLTDAEKRAVDVALDKFEADKKINDQRLANEKNEKELAKVRNEGLAVQSKELDAYAKTVESLADGNTKLREEIELVGLSEVAQARVLQLRNDAIILTKEQELADVQAADAVSGTMSRRAILLETEISKLRERNSLIGGKALAEENAKAAEAAQQAWVQVGDALVDSLMRGGKSVAQYLKDLFRTLVLQPILRPVGTAVGAMIGTLPTAANAGGTGALGAIGNLTGLVGIGGAFGGGLSAGFGGLMGSLGLAGTGTTLGGSLSAASIALGSGNIVGGLGTLIGALGPIALGIGAIAAAFGAFKKGGGPKVDGRFGALNSGIGSGGLDASVAQTVKGIQSTYDSLVKSFGGAGGLKFGLGMSTDPKGSSASFIETALARNGAVTFSDLNLNAPRDEEQLKAAVEAQTTRLLFEALKQSNLPAEYATLLAGGTEQEMTEQIARITALVEQRATVEERVFQATSTELGKLTRERERELAGLDEATAARVKYVHTLEDEQKKTERLLSMADRARGLARRFADDKDLNGVIAAQITERLTSAGLKITVDQVLGATKASFVDAVQQLHAAGNLDGVEAMLDVGSDFLTLMDRLEEPTRKANEELEQLKETLRGLGKDIYFFVRDLRATRGGTAAPEALVAGQRSSYVQDLSMARANDRDALGRIQQSASAYIEAQKGMTASSSATQAVIDQVIAELSSLPAVKSFETANLELLGAINLGIAGLPDAVATKLAGQIATVSLNVNGTLTLEQFSSVMAGKASDASVQALWGLLSVNGTATLQTLSGGFSAMDTNLDGLLTFDEVQTALAGKASDAEIRKLMSAVDGNKDGVVTKLELLSGITASINPTLSAALTGLGSTLGSRFDAIDVNVDGGISFPEMQTALAGKASDAELRNIWTLLDADGDGQITKLELLGGKQDATNLNLQELLNRIGTNSLLAYSAADIGKQFADINYNTGRAAEWARLTEVQVFQQGQAIVGAISGLRLSAAGGTTTLSGSPATITTASAGLGGSAPPAAAGPTFTAFVGSARIYGGPAGGIYRPDGSVIMDVPEFYNLASQALAGGVAAQKTSLLVDAGIDHALVQSVLGMYGNPAQWPAYERGTPFVPETGAAILHRGERVVPAADNALFGVMVQRLERIEEAIHLNTRTTGDGARQQIAAQHETTEAARSVAGAARARELDPVATAY